MSRVSETRVESPRRLSASLCLAVVAALALAQLVLGIHYLSSERERRMSVAGDYLEGVVIALGVERGEAALQERLASLRGSGLTVLAPLDYNDAPERLDRGEELIYRGHGVEARMSLTALDAELDALRGRLLIAGLACIAAACGGAWVFVRRSKAILAAERVELYARELEEKNEELVEARRRAESADRAKTEFLANVSHELRTPLTAILGFTDVLVERASADGAPPAEVEDARTIQRNGHYLYRLLAGLLDFANLEAGRLRIDWLACSPAQILADVEMTSRRDAVARGLRLRTEIDDDAPETMTTDGARVRQIVSQLVENAIKFTEDGSVSLRLSVIHEGFAQPRIAFDVIDTGVGMTPEQLESVFESFAQGDGSRSRPYGGLGLGLALGRRLARLLHGDITVVSNPSEGSAFRLMLPLAPPADAERAQPEDAPEEPVGEPLACRVLVAEDGADNRKLIDLILSRAGAEPTFAADGGEALEIALRSWREEEPFDVILMDMQMPRIDGLSATQGLRRAGYPGVIIALTADARADNREQCLKAGCDEFLSKPIDRQRLIRTIRSLLKRPS